jgi:hypothetical protein
MAWAQEESSKNGSLADMSLFNNKLLRLTDVLEIVKEKFPSYMKLCTC